MRNYTIAVVSAVSAFLIASPALAVVEISDGSVKALYHFNGDGVDSSGGGFNLTPYGAAVPATGLLGQGYDLPNTTSSYLRTTSRPSDVSDNFTMNCWLYSHDQTQAGDGRALMYNYDTSGGGYGLFNGITDNTHVGGLRGGLGWLDSGSNINAAEWKMLTMIRESNTWKWFIDGEPAASTGGTGNPSTILGGGFNVGCGEKLPYKCVQPTTGIVDECFFAEGVLPTPTLALLYNGGDGAEVCVTVGCGEATSTPTSTIATTTLSAADALMTYLLFMLDGIWFALVFLVVVAALGFVFYIKK